MVQNSSIETFIRKSIWQLTRKGNIVKYVPKKIKNGIVIGDCAVIKNKQKTFDIYSKQRKPIKKDITNHKVAIAVATLLNQYVDAYSDILKNLKDLDTKFAVAQANYVRLKDKIEDMPHLDQELDKWEEQVYDLSNQIENIYCDFTL